MVQYVRSTRFSVEGTLERPNAHSRRLLSRSTSCELVNVKILNGGYEDKTCVSSFTNQITQQLFGPKPLAAEQQTRLDQTEARRAVKILLETGPPPYLRDWPPPLTPPPPPPHYLKVWIRQCQWQVLPDTVSSKVHMEFNLKFEKKYFFLFFFFVLRFHFGMTTLCDLVWLLICCGLISSLIQILFS